jgi:hypothetical protein
MPRLRFLLLLCTTISLACLSRADAQNARGITIGAPKAFDNRTLNLMLERLNAQLANINVVDQKSLSQAIGTTQGSSVQETVRSLSVQGTAAPSTSATAAPALPDVLAAPSALTNLKYGMSSSDLLSEQVDLTYQIFNLQMLLDRSLSDRLLNPKFGPRLQTVVGLNVSLDPPRDAENAVAVVEITMTKNDDPCEKSGNCDEQPKCEPDAAPVEGPSLIAAMPQEHSYNSVALNSKANAFGGSAVTKLVTVGYSERRRGQTYYMFRDNDTVSFERQTCPGTGRVTFGWEFRPVLGRKSVSPGLRQLFAVLALPEDDAYRLQADKKSCDQSDPGTDISSVTYAIAIKAYWRKYDARTLTSANDREIRPWSKVGHALTLGTSLTYAPAGVTRISPYPFTVPLTSTYLDRLLPCFKSIAWHPVGTKQASIAIEGQNLFFDTQVAIADKLLTGPKDGLRLVSDQGMDIVTDLSALYGDVAILGRYGPAKLLEQDVADRIDLTIPTADYGAPLGGYITLAIPPLFNGGQQCLVAADLDDSRLGQPILFLDRTPIPGPYSYSSPLTSGPDDPKKPACLSIIARVPEATMPKLGGSVTLKFPFRTGLSTSQVLYDPNTAYRLQTLTANKDYLLHRLNSPFVRDGSSTTTANWRLVIGADPAIPLTYPCPEAPSKNSNTFCLLTPNDTLARILIGKTYACSNPPGKEEAPAPPDKTTPASSRKAAGPAKKKAKPASCGPDTFLLQNAITNKDKTLSWVGTYPLTAASGSSDSADSSDSSSSKPTLDADQSQAVNQHDLVWRSFTGKSLAATGEVTLGDRKLQTNPAKDGKSIAVLVPGWATANPAEMDVTFHDKQGSQIGIAKILVKSNSGASK